MQFHPEKCISLSVTRSQKTFHTSYILKGHTLESVTTAKYLGITISKDMNWDTHINNITSKANKIIGFSRRNLPIQNTETKTLAYKIHGQIKSGILRKCLVTSHRKTKK
jgi:hypothetical protein